MEKIKVEKGFVPSGFFPLPKAIVTMDIPPSAMVMYAVLLNRAMLSVRNGWKDPEGKLYFNYTLSTLAESTRMSVSTVKHNLNILVKEGLLEKKRPSPAAPNRWYIYVPMESENRTKKKPAPETDSRLSRRREQTKPFREKPVYEPLTEFEFNDRREQLKRMLLDMP